MSLPGDRRTRAIDLLEAQTSLTLAEQAALHGVRLADLHWAEAAAEAIEATVATRENNLRRWLSQTGSNLEPDLLRMHSASIEEGHRRYAEAKVRAEAAVEHAEMSRAALHAALSKRHKLREIRLRDQIRLRQIAAADESRINDDLWSQRPGRS